MDYLFYKRKFPYLEKDDADIYEAFVRFMYCEYDKATPILSRYLDDQHPEALWMYGEICYINGNYEDSFKNLSRAVQLGNNRAAYALGSLYENGLGTEKDVKKAFSLYLHGAVNNDNRAMEAMAHISHDNEKGEKTQARDMEYFWRQLPIDELNSGKILYHAQNEMERSYDQSFENKEIGRLLRISASLGNTEAMDYLVRGHEKFGDVKNAVEALKWLFAIEEKEELTSAQERSLKALKDKLRDLLNAEEQD